MWFLSILRKVYGFDSGEVLCYNDTGSGECAMLGSYSFLNLNVNNFEDAGVKLNDKGKIFDPITWNDVDTEDFFYNARYFHYINSCKFKNQIMNFFRFQKFLNSKKIRHISYP